MAPKSNTRGFGCLLLFALPFAAAGVFAGWLIFSEVRDALRTRAWVEVGARILATDLEVHHDDDSTTYQVTARYAYRYDGVEYESDRVGLSWGSDNVGSWHQDKHEILERTLRQGETFVCYVNPADPSQAILFRDLRWGRLGLLLVFTLAFGGVGFGMMIGGFLARDKGKETDQQELEHPEEPWLWRDDWRDGRVRSAQKATTIFLLIFAFFWNVISAPAVFFGIAELRDGNLLALLALLFPAIGLVLIVLAVRAWRRWQSYGGAQFEMAEIPGRIGGRLEGVVVAALDDVPSRAHVTLSCVNKARSGSSSGSSSDSERTLWQDDIQVRALSLQHTAGHVRIPLSMEVPKHLPPSDKSDIAWRLRVQIPDTSPSFDATFEVPVFSLRKGQEPRRIAASTFVPSTPTRSLEEDAPLAELMSAAKLRLEQGFGATRFVFPRARHPWIALFVTLFLLVWLGIVVALFGSDAPRFFAWIFAISALVPIFAAGELWLTRRWLEVGSGALRVGGGYLGLGRAHTFRADEVTDINVVDGMRSGNRLYHRLMLRSSRGDRLLATQLESLRLARRLAQEIEERLR